MYKYDCIEPAASLTPEKKNACSPIAIISFINKLYARKDLSVFRTFFQYGMESRKGSK